jgi:pentatricopeptide repeat protein
MAVQKSGKMRCRINGGWNKNTLQLTLWFTILLLSEAMRNSPLYLHPTTGAIPGATILQHSIAKVHIPHYHRNNIILGNTDHELPDDYFDQLDVFTDSLYCETTANVFIELDVADEANHIENDDDDFERNYEDDDDDESISFRPHDVNRSEHWLDDTTNDVLNYKKLPLGSLTQSHVESIVSLMTIWSRKNSMVAALTVDRLLKRVIEDMNAGNQDVFVSNRMYAITIDAWGRSGEICGAQRAQDIHDAMIQLYNETKDKRLRPTRRSFNVLLQSWARSGDPKAVKRGERILNQMMNEWDNDSKGRPDGTTIASMIELYGNDGSKTTVKKAERLFASVESLGIKKNWRVYMALQKVYRNDPHKSMEILQRMPHASDESTVRPNRYNFNLVLCAHSRASRPDSANQAINLLRKMELPVSEGGVDVAPDKLSYFFTMLTCSRHQNATIGANLAEKILLRMEERAEREAEERKEVSRTSPALVSLDTDSYNIVLSALSKSSDIDAYSRIIKIIKRMDSACLDDDVKPNLRSWTMALNALPQQRTMEAAHRGEKILKHMFHLYNCGKLNDKPDKYCYSSVLAAYQKLNSPEAAYGADKVLSAMEALYQEKILDQPPDIFHYTIVCSIWAKTGAKGGPNRCTELLCLTTERYNEGFEQCKPSIRLYNAILDCYSRAGQYERAEQLLYHMLSLSRKGDRDARPDPFSFDSVIHAFLRSGARDAGQRAESILERGLEFAEEEGGNMLGVRSFTAILGYYGHQSTVADSPYRAEYILNRLISLFQAGHEHLSPHVSCFTNVIDAYAAQRNRDAGQCAENIFQTMVKLKRNYGAQLIEINSGVVNTVLNAWEASAGSENAGPRAERLLDLMEKKSDEGIVEMSPTYSSYNKVIGTWAKSSSSNKVDRALEVLNRMKWRKMNGKLKSRIPEHSYALVINACAFSTARDPDEESRIFEIARNLFNELLSESEKFSYRAEPSPTTYGWFIQAIGNRALPKGVKFQVLKETFRRCCDKQRVNPFVLEKVKAACSDDEFAQLMPKRLNKRTKTEIRGEKERGNTKWLVNVSDLPEKWVWKGFSSTVGTSGKCEPQIVDTSS